MWTHPTEKPEPWKWRPVSWIDEFSIHHTVSPNREWTFEEEQEHVHAIYASHRAPGRFTPEDRRWSAPGIGYNWLAFPSGRIYYVGDVNTVRAAVGGQNHHIVACALVGDFTTEHPTGMQLDAVRALRENEWGELTKRPHRHYGGSACPGNSWEAWFSAV